MRGKLTTKRWRIYHEKVTESNTNTRTAGPKKRVKSRGLGKVRTFFFKERTKREWREGNSKRSNEIFWIIKNGSQKKRKKKRERGGGASLVPERKQINRTLQQGIVQDQFDIWRLSRERDGNVKIGWIRHCTLAVRLLFEEHFTETGNT